MTEESMVMIETIKALELQSKLLDPGENERQILFEKVNQYSENFLTTISTQPVYQNCPEEGANLYKQPIREEPEDLDTILKSFDTNVVQAGLNSASPGHFGYIPKQGNTNRFNQILMERIMNQGAVFMSSTMINGNFMLRLAVLSFRAHLEKVDQAITIIKDKIYEIENE